MTTALRAAYLNGPQTPPKLRSLFGKKMNSSHKIESIKGLKLQSFFYAVVASMADMELVLADMNPYRDLAAKTDYDRVMGAIRGVEQAFLDAGYSCKGEPYWADSSGPHNAQIAEIMTAAQDCVPILQMRAQKLQKEARCSPQDKVAFVRFMGRFAGFQDAMTGLDDHMSLHRYRQDQLLTVDGSPMCALA